MIQPNEIRINNLVIFDNCVCRISMINAADIVEVTSLDGQPKLFSTETTIEHILPIKLTEDVLLKCGFAKRLFEDTYSVGNIIVSLKYGIALLKSEGFPLLGKCECLHQLQNIWFNRWGIELEVDLTNQELEIEL